MDKKKIQELATLHSAEIKKEVLHAAYKRNGLRMSDGYEEIPKEYLAQIVTEICEDFSSRLLVEILSELLPENFDPSN